MSQVAGGRTDGRLALGATLIVVGGIALAVQVGEIDPAGWLGGSGWTLFLIVPGLALLVAGLVLRPSSPDLSIAGSIVSIIGLLLLYQDRNDHYESWAYAWALLAPGGVGLGLALHGLRTRRSDTIGAGIRMMLAAAVVFAIGALFFESVFDSGRIPFDIGQTWPVIVVLAGAILVVLGLVGGSRPAGGHPRDTDARPSDEAEAQPSSEA